MLLKDSSEVNRWWVAGGGDHSSPSPNFSVLVERNGGWRAPTWVFKNFGIFFFFGYGVGPNLLEGAFCWKRIIPPNKSDEITFFHYFLARQTGLFSDSFSCLHSENSPSIDLTNQILLVPCLGFCICVHTPRLLWKIKLSTFNMDEEAPLVAEKSDSKTPAKNHTRDVHILSSAFLLIFLAYSAAQNLETSINTEEDLGTISLGILYSSFTVFSLVASLVVRYLGSKNALVLGTTGYWLFIAANLKPTWYTMVPASLYLGFAASIIWVAEGTYITSTARSHAHDCDLHEGTVIGNFNGEFWGMFASNQLIGNLISLALLSVGTGGSTTGTTLLFIVFLCSMTLGTILMCFLQKRDGKGEEDLPDSSVSFYSLMVSLSKSVITPLCDSRMLLIVPLIAYSGLQQAFVWAEFTTYIVEPTLGVSGVAGAMAVYGAFDAICALTVGRLTSGLKSVTLIVSAGAFIQFIVLLWILLVYSLTSEGVGTVCIFLIAAALGIGDGVLNTQLSALLGMLFKHDTEGAFAQLKVWQSASIAVVFFMSPYISLQAMLVVMVAAVCIAMAGFLFLTLQIEKAFSSHAADI